MKKVAIIYFLLLAVFLSGCQNHIKNSQTRFLLNTVAVITANCSNSVLDGAFSVCQDYENLLSCTIENSDVYRLNNSDGFTQVNSDTLEIIERSIFYSDLSDKKFDITIYPLSSLWDFNNQIVPEKSELEEALKNIDYTSIEISGEMVNLNGKKIDLGAIAKGFIADKVREYLIKNNVKKGVINLGGNVIVFGDEYEVGIQKPFSTDVVATLHLTDKSAVTSGIYQRYIKEGDQFYHHILDITTGYGIENELASVTVIGDSSFDCDALSTVCMLIGLEKGMGLINKTSGFEAVFIEKNGNTILSDGLYFKKDYDIYLK